MYYALYQRDTLKKVFNMASIDDLKKGIKKVAMQDAVFDLVSALNAAGANLPTNRQNGANGVRH